jgi:hypothetical protein
MHQLSLEHMTVRGSHTGPTASAGAVVDASMLARASIEEMISRGVGGQRDHPHHIYKGGFWADPHPES